MSDLKPGEGDAELNERARRFAALLAAHSIKASADGDAVTTAAGAVVRASGEPWGSWVANGISIRDAFRALESALERRPQDADHALELAKVRRTFAFDPKPAAPAPTPSDECLALAWFKRVNDRDSDAGPGPVPVEEVLAYVINDSNLEEVEVLALLAEISAVRAERDALRAQLCDTEDALLAALDRVGMPADGTVPA